MGGEHVPFFSFEGTTPCSTCFSALRRHTDLWAENETANVRPKRFCLSSKKIGLHYVFWITLLSRVTIKPFVGGAPSRPSCS